MDTGYIVAALVVCGLIAMGVGRERGRGLGDSFMFGVVLGPIGIIIVAVLPAPAPKGMRSVTCARCTAKQNISVDDRQYECWQCHTPQKV